MMLLPAAFQTRHTLALLGFLGILNVYLCRLDLSIAIVDMVGSQSAVVAGTNVSLCSSGLEGDDGNATDAPTVRKGEFDWNPGAKGDLLGSYYYGYIWTQIPGGWLAAKYGFKKVFGVAMVASSVLTLLTPLASSGGLELLMAARVLIGLLHGVSFPAMHGAWTHWAPPAERTQLVSFHVAGASVGTVIIFPMGGVLAATYGWRAVFYTTGTLSLLWCVLWFWLVSDRPHESSRISPAELEHITSSLATEKRPCAGPTPWKAIFTSPPVWAVSAAHTASNWGNYQLNTLMPTYLDNVLRFDLKTNGLLSSLPFVLQSFNCIAAGWLTDVIRSRKWLTTIGVRKLNTALGLLVPAVTVVLAGYMGCRSELAVLFFTLSVGFNSFTVPGSKTSMLDFAPDYSGIIFGFSNTWANLTGFLAPQTTGHLLKSENSLQRWQLAFWISALVYLPGFIAFQIFGTDQLQKWAISSEAPAIEPETVAKGEDEEKNEKKEQDKCD